MDNVNGLKLPPRPDTKVGTLPLGKGENLTCFLRIASLLLRRGAPTVMSGLGGIL